MKRMMILLLAAALCGSCSQTHQSDCACPSFATTKLEPRPGLTNLYSAGVDVINGSAPESEEAFESLRELGIKTIISVEAATPDVERAKKYGMRYVHLPIGYDGVPRGVGLKIAKAIEGGTNEGRVYIHCYHGQNRSPAAAAFAAVVRGADKGEALAAMREMGVSERYKGLYESVRDAKRATDEEWAAVPVDFSEIAESRTLAQTMAQIERHFSNLELLEANGWEAPADHPDLSAKREVEVVADLLDGMVWDQEFRSQRDKVFGQKLDNAYRAALELRQDFNRPDLSGAGEHFQLLTRSCVECHAKYRD